MLRHKVPPEAKHLVRQHEVLSVRLLRKQHRKAIHLPPPPKDNAPSTRCFFFAEMGGEIRALLLGSFSHGHTVRSFAASCCKTRISLAHFGKKVPVVWQSTGLAPRRLQSRTFKSAPLPPRIAKPEFPSPIFGKKCRSSGRVLCGFSHGRTSPLLRRLVSQTPNFPRSFRQKAPVIRLGAVRLQSRAGSTRGHCTLCNVDIAGRADWAYWEYREWCLASCVPYSFEMPEHMAFCIICAFTLIIAFPVLPLSPCALRNVLFWHGACGPPQVCSRSHKKRPAKLFAGLGIPDVLFRFIPCDIWRPVSARLRSVWEKAVCRCRIAHAKIRRNLCR